MRGITEPPIPKPSADMPDTDPFAIPPDTPTPDVPDVEALDPPVTDQPQIYQFGGDLMMRFSETVAARFQSTTERAQGFGGAIVATDVTWEPVAPAPLPGFGDEEPKYLL